MPVVPATNEKFMRLALRLAQRTLGQTSPNPHVGAVLVKRGKIIGRGWHHRAGLPHAEIEALRDAQRHGYSPRGATLYVTLEPCCTHGRTPPCTDAIRAASIRCVVAASTDPNPVHAGRGFRLLRKAGLHVATGVLAEESAQINESFNHWIVHHTPFVTVKAAMTLDGKIATPEGQSKWITGERARAAGMKLRAASDAILVGVKTVLADDPSLTVRGVSAATGGRKAGSQLRRIILDSLARTPVTSQVVSDVFASLTTIVVTAAAPARRVAALRKRVNVMVAPAKAGRIHLGWLLKRLGRDCITSLLVEGGGEVIGGFLDQGLAQRLAFFYGSKILGGRSARRGVAGNGAHNAEEILALHEVKWRQLGPDLMLTALVGHRRA